jgi:hypothetical protein
VRQMLHTQEHLSKTRHHLLSKRTALPLTFICLAVLGSCLSIVPPAGPILVSMHVANAFPLPTHVLSDVQHCRRWACVTGACARSPRGQSSGLSGQNTPSLQPPERHHIPPHTLDLSHLTHMCCRAPQKLCMS